MGKKNRQTLKIPLRMVKLLYFGWCIKTPSQYKDAGNLLKWLPERKETAQGFHHDANGDLVCWL
jgi:hypothetical protein